MFKIPTAVAALPAVILVGFACGNSGLRAGGSDAGGKGTTGMGSTGGLGGTIGSGGAAGAGVDGTDGSTGEACGCVDSQGDYLAPSFCTCPAGPRTCPIPSLPCEAGYQPNPDPCACPTCAYCGDGILEDGEMCDLGPLNGVCLDAQLCPTKDYCCPPCNTDCTVILCVF
jgi:hypothetical protein